MTFDRLLAARSLRDVAAILETSDKALIWYLYRCAPEKRYLSFDIPKKSGGTRSILAPATSLKLIQGRLQKVLQDIYIPPSHAHGFLQGRDILSNAKSHRHANLLLNIDLKDFFPSINFGRVRGVFCAPPYNLDPNVATVLAQICCHNNMLPQGAPTSPILSNMICWRLDKTLSQLAKKFQCRYTRYADDITLSTKLDYFPPQLARTVTEKGTSRTVIGHILAHAVTTNGFSINPTKTRLTSRHNRLEVTGLTTNEFPNVKRKYIRQIRAMLHDWEATSLEQAEQRYRSMFECKHRHPSKAPASFRDVVRGKLNFLRHIRTPSNETYRALRARFERLDPEFKDLRLHNLHEGLLKATWVINSNTTYMQGTAFWLDGIGLVTCAHALSGDSVIYRADDPERKQFPVSVVKIDHEKDLAILTSDAVPELSLKADFGYKTKPGDAITIAGFPQHEDGHGLSRIEAKISQRCLDPKTKMRYWRVTGQIVAGNSGGPILNSRQRVIGVAVRGSDSFDVSQQTQIFGMIPIATLKDLVDS